MNENITNKAIAKTVTDVGEAIFAAIAASGDEGCTRREISARIGKKWNRWQIAQIELLIAEKRVEVSIRPTLLAHISEYVYKAI